MTIADHWRTIFEGWPSFIPKRGVLVTTFGEPITFVDFMVSGGIVLLERDRPDTLGARKVLLAYDNVAAVKITDVIDLVQFQGMGFRPPGE